jgi:transglutaminase-like putative cysteine protease/tetratricopeptide (TPR) repeat protein
MQPSALLSSIVRVVSRSLIAAAVFPVAMALAQVKPSPAAIPTTPGSGQAAAAAVAIKPNAYAEEAMVIERADTVYSFAADGTGTEERTVVVRLQSDAAARSLGIVSVGYAGNSSKVEYLYARVRHSDGTVVETPPSDALDMPAPVTREAPLYSDLKEKQIPIRSLRAGDTLEWKARITTFKAEAPNQFWGQENFIDDAVTLAQTIELRVPAGMAVTVWSPTVKPVESDVAASGTMPAQHVYRWGSSHLEPLAGKQAEAAAEAKKKQVWTAEQELDADQGKLPGIAWTTFKSWQEVGAWYQTLEAERVAPGAEVKAKAAELTVGKTTEEDKVRALYGYVATQVRYIGVDFGVGRYQPHAAAEILANQYGDCKDKHTLLAALLAAAGIPSDAALIGANVRFNPAVPSPGAFNHVITHRMLVSVIRDRQALVVPATGAAQLERTPAEPPFASFQTMDAVGTLDKQGTSHSHLTLVERGDVELVLRNAVRQTSPAQYGELVQQIVHGMGYAGTSSNPELGRPDETAAPFKMSFDYEREKSGDWDNYRIIPQVAPVTLPRYGDSDPLVRSLDLGTPRVETSTSAMKLPEGWTAILPEASHHKCAYATYDETYRFEKGTIYAERRIGVLKQKVPVAELKVYKQWANDADLGSEMYIQLVRHDAEAAQATTATADPKSITDVSKLLQNAYDDIGKMDLYNAKDLLDQARKLSPDHEFLWSGMGYLGFRNGNMTEAMTDYKKELELHPAAFKRMYPAIIQLQLVMHQRTDAMDSLRAWAKADPVDPTPVVQLLNLLVEDGNGRTAVVEGEAALQHLPADAEDHNGYVHVALGRAYLLAGQKQKGEAQLLGVLQSTEDALLINDASYYLADASLDLPLDESSTRKALDKLVQESSAWTLDEDATTLRGRSQQIDATWDTLGWTLFREGKLEEAQSYLEASWLGRPDLDTGEHVGALRAARGNKAGALDVYEMAIASAANYDALGVQTPPSEKQKKLEQAAEDLRSSGVKSAKTDPKARLQAMRTISLGSANGRNGTAEYHILLRDGKIVKAEPAGQREISGAEELMQKADVSRYFPAHAENSLVRTAFLNCHSKVCEIVIDP